MPTKLKVIYVLSCLPLIVGSLLFYTWYIARTCFEINIQIELSSFYTLIGFAVFSFVAIILCLDFRQENPNQGKRVYLPVLIILFTILLIYYYSTIYFNGSHIHYQL